MSVVGCDRAAGIDPKALAAFVQMTPTSQLSNGRERPHDGEHTFCVEDVQQQANIIVSQLGVLAHGVDGLLQLLGPLQSWLETIPVCKTGVRRDRPSEQLAPSEVIASKLDQFRRAIGSRL